MIWKEPSAENGWLAPHVAALLRCYRERTGQELLPKQGGENETEGPDVLSQRLWNAPFAVVSHNTDADPIFNYANRTALDLFAMTWDEFTILPSRLSAEPVHRDERARLMALVTANGCIRDYRGVRIAKTGCRFWIENATVWNLHNENGEYCGQAAAFAHWRFLDEAEMKSGAEKGTGR